MEPPAKRDTRGSVNRDGRKQHPPKDTRGSYRESCQGWTRAGARTRTRDPDHTVFVLPTEYIPSQETRVRSQKVDSLPITWSGYQGLDDSGKRE